MGDRRLKVAIIHQPWSIIVPPVRYADSIGIWIDEVARLLTGDCQIICYSRRGREQTPGEHYQGVEYRRVSARMDRAMRVLNLLDEWQILNPRRSFISSPWYYRQYISKISRDLQKEDVDVIHVQNYSQFVPILRARNPRAKIVLHMHAEWLTDFDPKLIEPRLAQVDQVIACSNYFTDSIRNGWPQYTDRCRTVYNGVTLSEFTRQRLFTETGPPRPKRVLYVGRVCPDKGTHVLVEAFEKVLTRIPDAELKIVGPLAMSKAVAVNLSREKQVQELAGFFSRPYLEELHSRMSPLGHRQIEITGQVERAELIEHYHQADVLVMPSIYGEGFGIPIVEAASVGIPTIATRRGGMPEVVVDGKTGLLVEAGDSDGLAAAILRLLEDDGLRASMGAAAYQRTVDHFTWEKIAESLLTTYRDITNLTPDCSSAIASASAR